MGPHLLYPDATCSQRVAVPCPVLRAPQVPQGPVRGEEAQPSRSAQPTEKPRRGQSAATGRQAGPRRVPRLSPEVPPAHLRWQWGPGKNEVRAEGL